MSWSKKPKKVAYVVLRGRVPGIYKTWDECKAQVDRYPEARYKGYYTAQEAQKAWDSSFYPGTAPVAQKPWKAPEPSPWKKSKTKGVLRAIEIRAQVLVDTFSRENGAGSTPGHTCEKEQCFYPACSCC